MNEATTQKLAPMPRGAVDDPSWNSTQLSADEREQKAEMDQVLDPAESMKARPDTKNLTLGEIKARDEDNLRLLLQGARELRFGTFPEAMLFIRVAIGRCMTKLGVNALVGGAPTPAAYDGALTSVPGGLYSPGQTREDIVAAQMVANDVRVEIRHPDQYPDGQDKWKAGMYVYHKGEIAFFISNPMADNNVVAAGGRIVIPHAHPQRFFVRTNAPVM